jgi:hypothetical protein
MSNFILKIKVPFCWKLKKLSFIEVEICLPALFMSLTVQRFEKLHCFAPRFFIFIIIIIIIIIIICVCNKNLKNEPCFYSSVLDGMLVVSAIFSAREKKFWNPNVCYDIYNICTEHWWWKICEDFFNLNKKLSKKKNSQFFFLHQNQNFKIK